MSMDPDGTNRIIKQQIKEWHAIVDGERDAHLIESGNGLRHSPIWALAGHLVAAPGRAIAALRSRWSHRPVA